MGACIVCKACKENEAVDKLIHVEKFEQMLNNKEILDRAKFAFSIDLKKCNLSYHYRNHLSDALYAEYLRQIKAMRIDQGKAVSSSRKGGNNGKNKMSKEEMNKVVKFQPKSKFAFDLLSHLKEIYYELAGRFDEFRENEETRALNQSNIRFFASMIEELRKIASDILRIEQSHAVVKDVMKSVLEDGLKIMVRDVVELSNIASLDDSTRERLASRLDNNIERIVERVDKQLKGKL